jgi:hypothetical protein
MNRRVFLWLLATFLIVPLLAREALAAPNKGFVFVRTQYQAGVPAPYQEITVTKLQGNYGVPPGPYVTNGVGQIWIALYPGVYRFTVTEGESTPSYWDVTVASNAEYYIYFNVSAPEQ